MNHVNANRAYHQDPPEKIVVSLTTSLRERIDRAARGPRSTWIRQACEEKLAREQGAPVDPGKA